MPREATLDRLPPYLMNRLVGRLNRDLTLALRGAGLSFAAWRVLAVLSAADGLPIVALSEFTAVPHATLSRLIARMARRRLVARDRAEDDARLVRVRLRSAGRAAHRHAFALARTASDRALKGFSAAERAALGRLLRRMLVNLGLRGPADGSSDSSRPPGSSRG